MRAQLCTLVLLTAEVGSYEYQRITQFWKLFKNLWRRNPQTQFKHSDITFGSLSLLMKLGGLHWEILTAYLPSFNPLAFSVGIGYYQRQVIRQVAYLQIITYLHWRRIRNCRTNGNGMVIAMLIQSIWKRTCAWLVAKKWDTRQNCCKEVKERKKNCKNGILIIIVFKKIHVINKRDAQCLSNM